MRKIQVIIMALFVLLPIISMAQVQNGYVRTTGTPSNLKGSPIPGVKITINGLNGYKVTSGNGTFNFDLGGGKKQFSIGSVTKDGFRLYSPLADSYNVGNARIELIMQSRKERAREFEKLTNSLEKKISNIYETEMSKKQNKIDLLSKSLATEKENTSALQKQVDQLEKEKEELIKQYQKRQSLIDDMAKKCVNLDYAAIGDKDILFSNFVRNGELERADSILKTVDINI